MDGAQQGQFCYIYSKIFCDQISGFLLNVCLPRTERYFYAQMPTPGHGVRLYFCLAFEAILVLEAPIILRNEILLCNLVVLSDPTSPVYGIGVSSSENLSL